jgi:hypothetical protein
MLLGDERSPDPDEGHEDGLGLVRVALLAELLVEGPEYGLDLPKLLDLSFELGKLSIFHRIGSSGARCGRRD